MGLLNLFDGLAEVAKLTIEAYEDVDFATKTGDKFTVMYNPNTFSQNYRSVWMDETPQGGSAETQAYRRLKSDSVSFDFLFDGTGVSGVGGTSVDLNPKVGEVGYVQEQINLFLAITQGLNGSTHEPNFLQLSWGTFIFSGVMESATVTYKLFHSSGAPLRANINATFKQSVSRTEQAAQARLTSPDLTHFKIVNEGETLPLIAKKIYGDSKYYLEIARVNNINNFRKLKAGQQLVLPPIDKKRMAESRIIPTQAETDLATFTVLSNGQAISSEIGVESIFVIKSVNKIPTARIAVVDGSIPREDFEVSSGDLFIPGNEIEIKAGYHSDESTIFKGIITKHSIQSKKDKPSFLFLDLKDESVKMTIGRKSKYFEDVKDSEIIEEIVGGYGLQSEIEATTVTHKEMVQHHVTDWDFLVNRAEVNGKLVFVDDGKVTVKAPDLSSEPTLELAYGHNVYDFEAGMDARDQFTAVKSSSWNFTDQAIVEGEADEPSFTEQGNFTASDLAGVIGLEELPLQHSGKIADDELKAWSDAKMMRSRLSKIKGKVKIQGFSDIKPGHVIELAGFGDRFNGVAFVSTVAHRMSAEEAWFTDIEFGLDKNWFTEIYNDIVEKPASGLVPSIHGLQIGIVTNIHEDPEGEERIRVRLPVIDKENDGVWARLTTIDAGDSRGWVFRPELSDEVIVGFLNGDPRDPIILGSVFSSAKPSPIQPEEENKIKGYVSRSEMKFTFDDDKIIVTTETPNSNKIILSDDEGKILIEDENGNKIEMSSDGITIESAKDINIKATGDVNIEGVNITVKAQSQFKAEGSAGAEMSTSGQAVVKGSIVMIN